MSALFPPWSNTAIRLGLVLLLAAVVAIPTGLIVYMRSPYAHDERFEVDQPVLFDHRHHVADDAIDCRYCHDTVETAATAGIPSTAVCMGCHNQIWSDSPALEPVRRSWSSGQPIPWNRVHDLPDFVFFNHAAHVTRGVGCVTCHGRVDRMARVYQVVPLSMQWCLGCHRDPTPHLRPLGAVTDMAWTPHGDATQGAELARALGVRSLVHCTTCHR